MLDVADVPPPLAPAMFACSRTAGWSAHILEQKKLNRLVRPSATLRRPRLRARLHRSRDPRRRLQRRPMRWRPRGTNAALATLRQQWDEELEHAARAADYRVRAQAYRAIAQFRFRQKLELVRRGLQDESPAARGSALIALEGLSRNHPGDVNSMRAMLHELASNDSEPGRAAARDRLLEERLRPARDDPDPGRPGRRRRTGAGAAQDCEDGRRRADRSGREQK